MGINYTFGIFLGEFMETFGTDKAVTSMVSSTQIGVIHLVDPVSAYLIDRFGCCKTSILGSVLAATGLITSGMAPNFAILYTTAGFLTGIVCDIIFFMSSSRFFLTYM